MRTLSAVESDTSYFDLEPLICDAESMVDVLYSLVDQHFAENPDEHGRYILSENDGSRLFFLAGLAASMAAKMREAYYVAHKNEQKARTMAGAS